MVLYGYLISLDRWNISSHLMALNKSYCSPLDRKIWDFLDLERKGSAFPIPIVPTPKLTTFVDIMPGEYPKIDGALSTYVYQSL